MKPDPSFHTTKLQSWLLRIKSGDRAARNELVSSICGRLEQLARRMLKNFPTVAQAADTGDVLQNSLVRLLRSLEGLEYDPNSTKEFIALAAEHIRRELLDLSRYFRSEKRGGRARRQSLDDGESGDEMLAPAAPDDDPDDLSLWSEFHLGVEQLPSREREVVGLIFYHGWTQTQVAELLNLSDRQVRRDWSSACKKLYDSLGGRLPVA